jgi:class 3 adenylate cyclase
LNNLISILLFTVCLIPSAVFAQEVVIGDSDKISSISEVLYLIDTTGSIEDKEVLSGNFDDTFVLANDDNVIDFSISAYWIKFSLVNSSLADQQVILEFSNWPLVEAYYRNNSRWNELKTGSLLSNEKKSYPFFDSNYILCDLDGQEKADFYIKLSTTFNGPKRPSKIGFKIGEKDQILKKRYNSLAFSFIFLGIFMIMIFYNTFIYISTKDRSYRFYLGTLFLYILSTIEFAGIAYHLLPAYKNLPTALLIFNSIGSGLLTVFVLLFVKDFYRVQERLPLWSKRINYLIVFILLSSLFLIVNYDIGTLLLVLSLFPFLYVVFAIGIKSYREEFPGAIYVLIGHFVWFIFAIAAMMGTINPWAREQDFFSNQALLTGASLEMMLFALALANTINYLMRENKSKQERIIKQLQENSELQTKVNRELESKVAERTNELLKQSQEIETQKKDLEIEKDRSDSLLLNILPLEIAEELKSSGHATPKYYESVTVLFVDITSFSKMVRKLSPEKLVEGLDYLFSEFDDITTKYNLEKIKTIGDAYMCVGGLPQTNETHPYDATNAAFEMLEVIKYWAKNKVDIDLEGLNLRAGIHTGPVTAGVVGKKKFQFDIWGDAVNLASRMESGGEAGKVNVSEKTYHIIKDKFECTYRGKFPVKNMGEVDMYFANGVKA